MLGEIFLGVGVLVYTVGVFFLGMIVGGHRLLGILEHRLEPDLFREVETRGLGRPDPDVAYERKLRRTGWEQRKG